MLNFKNLSPPADFSSKLNHLEIQLEIINKNVLYITHECDKIKKIVNKLEIDENLQNTVDQYFEKDGTSPQTDSETKGSLN